MTQAGEKVEQAKGRPSAVLTINRQQGASLLHEEQDHAVPSSLR